MKKASTRVVVMLCFLLAAWARLASAQTSPDPILGLTGSWDLVGTRVNIKIHSDHTVQHWKLGVGDISQENAGFFTIMYHQHELICRYEIKKYGRDELAFVIASQPSDDECNLGVMRRVEETGAEPNMPGKDGAKSIIKDCESCPEMVVAPEGSFLMGAPPYEEGRGRDNGEGPQRRVVVGRPFAVGRFAITVDEFKEFVDATGYRTGDLCAAGNEFIARSAGSFEAPPGFAPGFVQTARHPAVCVSWQDAKAFVAWLSKKTKRNYRLLTEAEREYVTRAGASTAYWWGEGITPSQALYDCSSPLASKGISAVINAPTKGGTAPVDRYRPNDWGLFQVHGNVAEWVEDCWTPTIASASSSPAAVELANCKDHVLRGGAWSYPKTALRAAFREHAPADGRYNHVGFRVARDLDEP